MIHIIIKIATLNNVTKIFLISLTKLISMAFQLSYFFNLDSCDFFFLSKIKSLFEYCFFIIKSIFN